MKNDQLNKSTVETEFYQLALDNCPEDIFAVAQNGSVLYINEAACARRAISKERILEQFVWEWNHFISEASWQKFWDDLTLSKNAIFQTEHIRPNGERYPVRINVQMIKFADQDAALCFVRDISHFKETEQRANTYGNQLNLVFSGSGICLCSWNPITDQVRFDTAWVSLFGARSQSYEMSFNEWREMIAPANRDEWYRLLIAHIQGKDHVFKMTLQMQTVDGRWLWVHSRGQVIAMDENGAPSLVSIMHEDITERVDMQSKIESNIKVLELQAEELKLAKDQAEHNLASMVEIERKRDLLYATVAHELRTPISSLSMMASEDSCEEWTHHQQDTKQICRDLIHTLDDMRRLVNPDLCPEIKLEPFKISDLMQSVATSVSAYTAITGIRFEIQINLPEEIRQHIYQSDLYRLKVVLSNLIKNACLHSGASTLVFSVQLIQSNEGEEFVWSIIDDGKGIPNDKINKLMNPLERGQTKAMGTGMGMYIAKTWIQEIGGELSFVPSEQGAQFNVHLAMKGLPKNEQTDQYNQRGFDEISTEPSISNLRVLMVEDEPMLRMIGQKILKKVFNKVDIASNGVEALERVKSRDYELILTDYFMPKMNGLELIKELRAQGCSSLIVGITAATLGTERSDMKAAGANKVFSKPLNRAALEAWLIGQAKNNEEANCDTALVEKQKSDTKETAMFRINLNNGFISANNAWLELNELKPETKITIQLLHSTIDPNDLEKFKTYARAMIKDPALGSIQVIDLNLIGNKGRTFIGRVSSQKLENSQGIYIESSLIELMTH